jgi:hypothetical protein
MRNFRSVLASRQYARLPKSATHHDPFESEAMVDTDARRNDDCTSPERQLGLGQKEALEDERSAGQSTMIMRCSKNVVVVGRILG